MCERQRENKQEKKMGCELEVGERGGKRERAKERQTDNLKYRQVDRQ